MMDILGIGECMIEMDGESPLSFSTPFKCQVGGDVYNTLVAASRLGSHSGFVSRIVMDDFGNLLLDHFDQNRIDTRHVKRFSDGVNGIYFALVNAQRQHEFVYYRQNSIASQMTPAQITPAMIADTRIVYATGVTQAISKTARQTVLKAFQLAKEAGVLVAYDPNYRPRLWKKRDEALDAMVEVLPYVNVLLPSWEDLSLMFDFPDEDHALEYFRLRGVPLAVLKRGNQGAILSFKNQRESISAYGMGEIQDTIGAGDAFNGGFLHGLYKDHSLLDCARIGTLVASCSLRKTGPIDGLPYWNEVADVLRQPSFAMALSNP